MRLLSVLMCFGLMGCGAPSLEGANFETAKPVAVRAALSAHDIVLNRPNTDRPEAVLQLAADGTGTVAFIANADGAQDVTWTLSGDVFCMDAQEGLMAHFDCAKLRLDGTVLTLAHTRSDSVVRGVLRPR